MLVYLRPQRKPVVLAGDLNCAHQEIDIARPKTNLRSAGFTQVCGLQHMREILCVGCYWGGARGCTWYIAHSC